MNNNLIPKSKHLMYILNLKSPHNQDKPGPCYNTTNLPLNTHVLDERIF